MYFHFFAVLPWNNFAFNWFDTSLNEWEKSCWLKLLCHQKRDWFKGELWYILLYISFIILNTNFFFLNVFSQLTPIEKYALNYLELFHVSVDENEPRLNEVKS